MNSSLPVRLIAFGLFVSCIIVPLLTYGIMARIDTVAIESSQLTSHPPERTNKQLLTAIIATSSPLRKSNENVTLTITGKKHLAPNWYCVWVGDNKLKVLVNDPSNDPSLMQVLFGPAPVLSRSTSELAAIGIPSTVFMEFINAQL